jgi:hypothetical protein
MQMVVFETAVVDPTEKLGNPVDVLFRTQLGGGTDVKLALRGRQREMLERVAALSGGGVQKITLLALSDERTQQNSQNKEKDAEPGRDDALSGNLVTSLDDHDGTCGQMITALSASHHVSVSTQACNQLKPTLASPNSVVAQLENSASKSASRAVTVQYPGSAKTIAWPFMGVSDVCATDKYLRCNSLRVRFRPSPPNSSSR